jgi:hypothetical protein
VNKLVGRQHDQESQAILDWLTSTNYYPQQNDFINRRQEGTGEWLLKSYQFQQWENGEEHILFCPGIPGAGKTLSASIVIDHLCKRFRNDPGVSIAFIYCNFRQQQEQQLIDLFSSLLKQFSQKQPSLFECVIKLYEDHQRDQTRPSLREISTVLQTVIAGFSRAFIIIDALDEYEASHRTKLLSEIFEMQGKTNLSLFATSRFIPDISDRFTEKMATFLEIQATHEDVEKYIDGNLYKLPPFVLHNSNLQTEIKNEIVKAVCGMYGLSSLYDMTLNLHIIGFYLLNSI